METGENPPSTLQARGYAQLRSTIHPLLENYLQGAEDETWPCMPDKCQFQDQPLSEGQDLRTLLRSKNTTYTDKTEYQVLKECLYRAIKEKLYGKAMATVFILDRFSYWLHRKETKELLDLVDVIVQNCPEVPVPPQVMVRKARVLKDDGAVQTADRLLAFVISQGMDGYWHYKERKQYLMVAANCLGIRGQIRYNLGIWKDAVQYLVGSIHIANLLPSPDEKALAISLQILTDILCNLSLSDYRELQESMEFQVQDPLLQADLFNRQSAYLVRPDAFYYPMRMMKGAEIVLTYASQAEEKARNDLINDALERIKNALVMQTSKEGLTSRDRLHDLAVTIFSLYASLRLKGDSNTKVLELCRAVYNAFCLKIWPLENEEQDKLNDVLTWLGLPGLGAQRPAAECEPPDNFRYPKMRDDNPENWVNVGAKETVISIDVKFEDIGINENDNMGDQSPEIEAGTVDPCGPTQMWEPTTQLSKRQPGLFDNRTRSSTENATMPDDTVYQSHLTDMINTFDGFEAPQNLLEEQIHVTIEVNPDERILDTKLTKNTIYQANLAKYHPLDNRWYYQKTLVFIDDELELPQKKKGAMRDVIKLQFLHQEEKKGQYLGKKYRKRSRPKNYHDDVIIHQLSRHYVTLFNQALQSFPELANQIQMVPVAHLEVLDDQQRILEFLNVEPFIRGDFKKITNNENFVNTRLDTNLLLAFSHFTWCQSQGKLMVTDLQGWVPDDKRVPVILTDPAINSKEMKTLGIVNMSAAGLEGFWTKQHKTCNHVCEKLSLYRDD